MNEFDLMNVIESLITVKLHYTLSAEVENSLRATIKIVCKEMVGLIEKKDSEIEQK